MSTSPDQVYVVLALHTIRTSSADIYMVSQESPIFSEKYLFHLCQSLRAAVHIQDTLSVMTMRKFDVENDSFCVVFNFGNLGISYEVASPEKSPKRLAFTRENFTNLETFGTNILLQNLEKYSTVAIVSP